ncbi:MAG: MoxR family ATPase [Pyrinomonadaceae bacterium]|nr:MoxR family ATPase [Pyrinomonadaceae bacterium]
MREEVRQIQRMLEQQVYVTDAAIATALYLSMTLGKPLLVEGPAGVGKTEIAKALSNALGTKLIRLQCYEGLDATTALYEWNYPKQLLHIKLEESSPTSEAEKEAAIFSEAFLLKRPLLQAITEHERAPVLLIDEIDRSDEEFEAFLLEVLSDFQVTIPEIGTIKATHRPHVVLTSNRSRDLSDALRRRCLYHWIDYPSLEKELEIVRAKVPAMSETLSSKITLVMQAARAMSLSKVPGIAETLDWATALVALDAERLDRDLMKETMGCFLKDEADIGTFTSELEGGRLEMVDATATPQVE